MVKHECTSFPPGFDPLPPNSTTTTTTAVESSSPEQGTRRTQRKRNQPEFFEPPVRRQRTATPRRRGRPPKGQTASFPRRIGRPPEGQTASFPRRRGRPPKPRGSTSLFSLQEAHKRDSNEVSSTRPQGQIVKPIQLTNAQSSSQAKNEARTINQPAVVLRCERSNNVGWKNKMSEGIDPNIFQHVADALQYMTVSQTSVQYENVSEQNLLHTLQAIYNKYGDITKDCSLESDRMRSLVLIGICQVVQDLEKKRLEDLDISSLDSYYTAVMDAEIMKVNVQWLHKRLDEIKHAVTLSAEAKGMVNERNAHLVNIDRKKEELLLRTVELERIKSQVAEIEEQLVQEDVVVNELCKIYGDHMSRISQFQQQRMNLMDGLL